MEKNLENNKNKLDEGQEARGKEDPVKAEAEKEALEDKYLKNLSFMNRSDEEIQKDLDFYSKYPQLKYQHEMFAKQYDDPDKELSKAAKVYSILHNARSGMEALPAAVGLSGSAPIVATILNSIVSAAGGDKILQEYYNGKDHLLGTEAIKIKGKTGDILTDSDEVERARQITDAMRNKKSDITKTIHIKEVPEFTDRKPQLTPDRQIFTPEYNPDESQIARGNRHLKQTIKDLKDPTPPEKPGYTTIGKELSMKHPKIAGAISTALDAAKLAENMAASYGVGALVNKGDKNYSQPLAEKYTREYFYDLPKASRDKIKEEGLNEDIFNNFVAPYIKFIDERKYNIDEPTLKNMLENKKFDELKLKYGIDTADWQKADSKTKDKLENYWLTAKDHKRAFEKGE